MLQSRALQDIQTVLQKRGVHLQATGTDTQISDLKTALSRMKQAALDRPVWSKHLGPEHSGLSHKPAPASPPPPLPGVSFRPSPSGLCPAGHGPSPPFHFGNIPRGPVCVSSISTTIHLKKYVFIFFFRFSMYCSLQQIQIVPKKCKDGKKNAPVTLLTFEDDSILEHFVLNSFFFA